MLQKLRSIAVDRLDVEDCVELLAYGKMVVGEMQSTEIPVPDWLTDSLSTLKNEVKARRRDALEKALRQAKLRQQSMKTLDEKRKDTADEIERLEKLLA